MLTSFGYLNYRDDSLVIEVDQDLGRYLRRLLFLSTYSIVKLQEPARGNHITVVSKYERGSLNFSSFNGIRIDFSIELDLYTNGNAFWSPVSSSQAQTIRESVGLGAPYNPFHFGIGYIKEGKLNEYI